MNQSALKQRCYEAWQQGDLDRMLHWAGRLAKERGAAAEPIQPDDERLASLAEACLHGEDFPALLAQPGLALALGEHLKKLAEGYCLSDQVQQAFHCAERVAALAAQIGEPRLTALSLMIRGESYNAQGGADHAQKGWDCLLQAGELYLQEGDPLGWARSCIGRSGIATRVNRVDQVLADAARAEKIFQHYRNHARLLRLAINRIALSNERAEYQPALQIYETTRAFLGPLLEADAQQHAILLNNVGLSQLYLGDFHLARGQFQQANAIFQAQGNSAAARITLQNIAYIDLSLGRYQQALQALHHILQDLGEESIYWQRIRIDLLQCYLELNQHAEALALGRLVMRNLYALGDEGSPDLGQVLCYSAMAAAALGDFDAAQRDLQSARHLFLNLNAQGWSAYIALLQGRLALRRGQAQPAYHYAADAADYFAQQRQQVNHLQAVLLQAQAQLHLGEGGAARQRVQSIMAAARRLNIPDLRYRAHLLLGQLAAQGRQQYRAMRHYRAATAVLERVQRDLTITLRPGFLEDKVEAGQAMIQLALAQGQAESALALLERTKSQTLLGYLVNRERLIWRRDDPQTQPLLEKLEERRAEHHWLYHSVQGLDLRREDDPQLPLGELQQRLARCEQEMKQLTEQLYLHSAATWGYTPLPEPDLSAVRAQLAPDALLLAYFDDGQALSLFTVTAAEVRVYPQIASSAAVAAALEKLQLNISFGLHAPLESAQGQALSRIFRQYSQQLYALLLAPAAAQLARARQLIIVPYGRLHYLPFHLLHNGDHYLLESHESVVLPAMSLLNRPIPQREGGARILACDAAHLEHTHTEARQVAQHFPQHDLAMAAGAVRARLREAPLQILHIAAHGEHRMDRPDLSYLQLHDGYLYSDDLLQYDLSYELVTLSACETGLARVMASEDFIGLGRSVLLAGAGAMLVSLWLVADALAPRLMSHFYDALLQGQSKANALRLAQCHLLQALPQAHPATWAAFQLIGHPGPLSRSPVNAAGG